MEFRISPISFSFRMIISLYQKAPKDFRKAFKTIFKAIKNLARKSNDPEFPSQELDDIKIIILSEFKLMELFTRFFRYENVNQLEREFLKLWQSLSRNQEPILPDKVKEIYSLAEQLELLRSLIEVIKVCGIELPKPLNQLYMKDKPLFIEDFLTLFIERNKSEYGVKDCHNPAPEADEDDN